MGTLHANQGRKSARLSISNRVYSLLLSAYPKGFRLEYGPLMAQLFRDCFRAQRSQGNRFGIFWFWIRTLSDLTTSATKQQLENLAEKKNAPSEIFFLFGCTSIIVIAAALLSIGRTLQLYHVLRAGFVLDALVFSGVAGNLLVFVLVKTLRFDHQRSALWTFLAINSLPVIGLAFTGGIKDPGFRSANVMVGYLVSFIFWYGLHWAWTQGRAGCGAVSN